MSTTSGPPRTRVPLAVARELADELVDLIGSSCEQFHVCGSIRRQAPTVGDIDLVVVPMLAPLTDLFGATDGHISVLNHRLDNLCGEQVIRQARRPDGGIAGWGQKLRKFIFHELPVQCQSVEADALGMWLLIRTGPSGYSHAFVTPRGQKAAIRRGAEVVAHRDGMLPPGFEVKDGFRLYRYGGFVPTPTERDVYEALGRPYVEPWDRR